MRLTARWQKDQDTTMEEPCWIRWGDGTAATLDDYRKHQLDTHTLRFEDPDCIQLDMYPDIVAEVMFDRDARDWVVRGPGVATVGLELHDPNAKDEQIIAELYSFPLVYRANIVRYSASLEIPSQRNGEN
jgi:hypothetical protein